MLGRRFDDGGGEPDGVWSGTTELSFITDDSGEGFAIVSRKLGGANFSPELRYPVQLIYRSDSADAGLFGTSWRSPQLESSAIPEKDGVLWTTPWGEKIRFFAKTKDKDALDLYKDAMKGPKPYFSPYSEWEADGKEGNWIFYGKRTLEGWKLAYRDAKLIAITAPSGAKSSSATTTAARRR